MVDNYEINSKTLAVLAVDNYRTKIIEEENVYFLEKKVHDIIDHSCKYFGSSYLGRHEGTKNMIGINYKTPILIEESKNIIFFPTCSTRNSDCFWISLNHIKEYQKTVHFSKIIFKNGYELETNISYGSLENQILRSTLLESVLRNRKKMI